MTTAKRLWKSFICCFIAAKPVKSLFSINFSCFCPTFQSIVHYAKRFRWSREKVRSICTGGVLKVPAERQFSTSLPAKCAAKPGLVNLPRVSIHPKYFNSIKQRSRVVLCGTKLNSWHCLCQLIDPWWTWHGEHCWLCWTNSNTRLTVFLIIII